MTNDSPRTDLPLIDPFLFEKYFQRFAQLVFEKSNQRLISFSSNSYTETEEGYKYGLYSRARSVLQMAKWRKGHIGTGRILSQVIQAIELDDNNLFKWQGRWGPESKPHKKLYAVRDTISRRELEDSFYTLYLRNDDHAVFDRLVELLGKKYNVVAYFFFLKDRSRYLPIAPVYFDRAFRMLGVSLVTAHHCSWENYSIYNQVLFSVKDLLTERLEEVSLLDAHSFVWMLANQLANSEPLEVTRYKLLTQKDREVISKARIGQGPFRTALKRYWTTCAITHCREEALLTASHIKPWAECNVTEAVDPYNGILLSPVLNAAFDEGFISFSDDGAILISPRFSEDDRRSLGISSTMKLVRLTDKHRTYLNYHRLNKFKSS